jgi:hypothetical protein
MLQFFFMVIANAAVGFMVSVIYLMNAKKIMKSHINVHSVPISLTASGSSKLHRDKLSCNRCATAKRK